MKHMGIDFGTKKIGIAVSDTEGKFAFPKSILKNDPSLISAIKKLCEAETVGRIILGESIDFSGQPNAVMPEIHAFKQRIEEATGLPVVFQKEFMTSVEARRPLDGKKSLAARKVKKENPGNVDASAAALILQRYLDTIN